MQRFDKVKSVAVKKPCGLTVDEWLNVVNQKEIEFNFDESSGDFYVNNLISLETDPRDATKEVFAKLRGKVNVIDFISWFTFQNKILFQSVFPNTILICQKCQQ